MFTITITPPTNTNLIVVNNKMNLGLEQEEFYISKRYIPQFSYSYDSYEEFSNIYDKLIIGNIYAHNNKPDAIDFHEEYALWRFLGNHEYHVLKHTSAANRYKNVPSQENTFFGFLNIF